MRQREHSRISGIEEADALREKLNGMLKDEPMPVYILAAAMGMSINAMRRFLSGKHTVTLGTRIKIKSFLESI